MKSILSLASLFILSASADNCDAIIDAAKALTTSSCGVKESVCGGDAKPPTDAVTTAKPPTKPPVDPPSGAMKGMYFGNWYQYREDRPYTKLGSLSGIANMKTVTHIFHAFFTLWMDGSILEIEWNEKDLVKEIVELKKEHGFKYLVSVGGWTRSQNYSDIIRDPSIRAKMADSAVKVVEEYGFDGVDIDYEFPAYGGCTTDCGAEWGGAPPKHDPENDWQNYIYLVREIRAKFDSVFGPKGSANYKEVSAAVGPNPKITKNANEKSEGLAAFCGALDFVNLMAYDYNGAWSAFTGHNAPLYPDPIDPTVKQEGDEWAIDWLVNYYIDSGCAPSKLNMGLPSYARAWKNVPDGGNNGLYQSGEAGAYPVTENTQDYFWVRDVLTKSDGFKTYYSEITKSGYAYNGDIFMALPSAKEMEDKVAYMKTKGLGGYFFWESTGDQGVKVEDMYELQDAACAAWEGSVCPKWTPSGGGSAGGSVKTTKTCMPDGVFLLESCSTCEERACPGGTNTECGSGMKCLSKVACGSWGTPQTYCGPESGSGGSGGGSTGGGNTGGNTGGGSAPGTKSDFHCLNPEHFMIDTCSECGTRACPGGSDAECGSGMKCFNTVACGGWTTPQKYCKDQ